MANASKLFLLTVLLAFIMGSMAMARSLVPSSSSSSLLSRLKLDDESSNCWDSLTQLQSCSGEIILFFLNGETDLGQGCCPAIRTIGSQCWPTMIGTIGFTAEEEDILEGYCDRDETSDVQSPPSPPSVGLTRVATVKT